MQVLAYTCGIFTCMLSLSTYNIQDLFFAAGLQPTPALLDLALPDVLVGACKVHFARSAGAKFKAPPPAGAEGDAVWYIDERALTVLVGRLDQHLSTFNYQQAEDTLDEIRAQVADQEVRALMLRAFVEAVAFIAGLTGQEVEALTGYANACM